MKATTFQWRTRSVLAMTWVFTLLLGGIMACGGDAGDNVENTDAPDVAEKKADMATAIDVHQIDQAIDQFPDEIREVVERLEDGRVRLDAIEIDPAKATIAFDGHVNMNEGLIEVMVCTSFGKTHESLFVTEARPMYLHAACLLLGFRHGRNPAWLLPEDDPELDELRNEQVGDMLDVVVSWVDDQGPHEVPAGQFLLDEKTGKTLEKVDWVFTGSYIDPAGVYAADRVGSMITNFHDFTATIDLALERGRIDDYMVANKSAMPVKGASVHITIRKAK